jgi:dinuclear metal center YbgI/SA1388 family protein
MQIKDILREIELFAPLVYQEGYDNCGVQVGDVMLDAQAALLTLDVTEAVIDEAIELGCNLIIAHHPLIFSGLKKIAGRNYVERCIIKAIKNDITIYAAHTNLDNVRNGVNYKIAQKLGLQHCRTLSPVKHKLYKLYTYAPKESVEKVKDALFSAGAGHIGNYSECSFETTGLGNFKPGTDAQPTIGEAGGKREDVEEKKIEVLVPEAFIGAVIASLRQSHPYEEVAYELIKLENVHQEIGAGLVGELPVPLTPAEFLTLVKRVFRANGIRYTSTSESLISRVALCGGSGSFLLPQAIASGAEAFITADFKYHQFFDAEGKLMITDIGHYESEQYTIEIFSEIIKKKFPNFALRFSKINTNPVNYF